MDKIVDNLEDTAVLGTAIVLSINSASVARDVAASVAPALATVARDVATEAPPAADVVFADLNTSSPALKAELDVPAPISAAAAQAFRELDEEGAGARH